MFDRLYDGFNEYLKKMELKESDDEKWKIFWELWNKKETTHGTLDEWLEANAK